MCQLGICTFHYDQETQKYIARPFTIYTIPYSDNRTLCVSIDSMQFLLENHFDINKLIREGITCCRLSEIDIENFEDDSSKYTESVCVSNEHAELMDSYTERVKEFIISKDKETNINIPNEYIKKMFYGANGVVMRFRGIEFSTNNKNEEIWINVRKIKQRDSGFNEFTEKKESSEEKNVRLMNRLGVTQIFSAILEKRVPLIMHNPLFDICYLYNHFIGSLPNSYLEFKSDVLNIFPDVYDTKYIINKQLGKEK